MDKLQIPVLHVSCGKVVVSCANDPSMKGQKWLVILQNTPSSSYGCEGISSFLNHNW